MASVYRNACPNIGASAAALPDTNRLGWMIPDARIGSKAPTGLFASRNPSALSMLHVEISHEGQSSEYLGFTSALQTDGHTHGPLMERGWIWQERFLSPRSVYFGGQLTWECSEFLANEVFPAGFPSSRLISPWNLNSPLRINSLLKPEQFEHVEYTNGIRINDWYRTWLYLVEKC